jgi:hypothetical protein
MEIYKAIKKDITNLLVALVIVHYSFVFLSWAFEWGFDSTDGKTRSNMGLHIDAMTSCQYLSAKGGGITPRMNKEGEHVCEVEL